MPTYAYACTECGHEFDAVQSFSDDALTTCPECGGALRKKFGSVGVVFKGGGFYKTDSRAAESTSSGTSKSSGAAKGSGDAKGSSTGSSGDGSSGAGSSGGTSASSTASSASGTSSATKGSSTD